MLDLLFNPEKAERHPFELMAIGAFYSTLSIFIGLWLFNTSTSLAIVFLTILSCLYVVNGALKMEEKKDKNYNEEGWILKEHKKIMILFLSLFLGFTISFIFWSYVLPLEVASKVFELQSISVDQIRSITGNSVTGNVVNIEGPFVQIITNNIKIISISLIFALFYGAGAIYILAWNASVMGFVIGSIARESNSLLAIPLAILKYGIHGIPEMLAYVVAAVAGGILYFALIKGDLVKKERVKRLAIDTIALIFISIILLVFSAILEIYVSPFF